MSNQVAAAQRVPLVGSSDTEGSALKATEDLLLAPFVSEAHFRKELDLQRITPSRNRGFSALLRIRLDAHALPFGGADGDCSAERLRLTLNRLQSCFRTSDLLANPKPGIILVLLRNLRCEDDLELICERVVSTGKKPLQLAGGLSYSGFSLGAAVITDQHSSSDSLIQEAESAMLRPRDEGSNGLEFRSLEFTEGDSIAMKVESYVRCALQDNLLGMYFQPQYTQQYDLAGVAAHTRMRLHRGKWLDSEEFLPWVEDSDLILQLSRQALRATFLQAADWLRRQVPIHSISVIIPTVHLLQKNFVETVLSLLKETGVPGNVFEFGLTEASIVADVESTTKTLGLLSKQGVRFYVCGFGLVPLPTSYLRSLPIQTLQVSCSENKQQAASSINILRAIISHGRRLGLNVRVLDVQSDELRTALFIAGCDVCEEHLMYRALSWEEMEKASFSPIDFYRENSNKLSDGASLEP